MSGAETKPLFRPMLAFDADWEYYERRLLGGQELWASNKLDGIRAMVLNGKLVSRTLKRIPNHFTRSLFERPEFEGLDGELIVGAPNGDGVFARTASGVMSMGGEPDVWYHVFDFTNMRGCNFRMRHEHLVYWRQITNPMMLPEIERVRLVGQLTLAHPSNLKFAEDQAIQNQYEGLIIKDPNSMYKNGRSTPREGYMGKLKRFLDDEAIITDFEELMHNDNPATLSALGLTVRSSHKANQRPGGMLGTLTVRSVSRPQWVFGIGSGFDHDLRKRIWDNRETFRGRIVKYKYLPVGTLDAPRHPIFLGFRDPADMDVPS